MLVPVAVANRDDRRHRRVRLVELARRDVVALVGAVFDQLSGRKVVVTDPVVARAGSAWPRPGAKRRQFMNKSGRAYAPPNAIANAITRPAATATALTMLQAVSS